VAIRFFIAKLKWWVKNRNLKTKYSQGKFKMDEFIDSTAFLIDGTGKWLEVLLKGIILLKGKPLLCTRLSYPCLIKSGSH
jgi:hypothetical protein